MPDYEIVLWDKERVESVNSRYLNEAIVNRRYAFAADYIRFYALYTYVLYIYTKINKFLCKKIKKSV